MNHVATKKLTEAKLKKPSELMTLAGLPPAGAISKPHDYKQNVQKRKNLLKKWVSTSNSLKVQTKKTKNPVIAWRTKQKNRNTPKAKTKHEPCSQEELNWSEIEKAFRLKLLEFSKNRTKQSNPDLLTFYVISGGHDMANDAGPATTYRRNFKDPWLQTQRTKNEEPSEKMRFNGETGWRFQTRKFKNSTPRIENKTKEPQVPKAENWTWTM